MLEEKTLNCSRPPSKFHGQTEIEPRVPMNQRFVQCTIYCIIGWEWGLRQALAGNHPLFSHIVHMCWLVSLLPSSTHSFPTRVTLLPAPYFYTWWRVSRAALIWISFGKETLDISGICFIYRWQQKKQICYTTSDQTQRERERDWL